MTVAQRRSFAAKSAVPVCFHMLPRRTHAGAIDRRRRGRSLKHLIETITQLHSRGIGFKSLTEQIDTTTSGGKLIFHIFGALAEFERDIIRERTQAGLAAARARGRRGGRRKTLTPKQIAMVKKLYADKTTPIKDICKSFHISRMTLWRYLNDGPNSLT